jgi:hypothetical protein
MPFCPVRMHCLWALILPLATACSQPDGRDPGTLPWPDSVERFVSSGQIFAASYSIESVEGKYLRLSLHQFGDREACRQYAEDLIVDSTFLRVQTNAYGVGKFAVVQRITADVATPQAEVKLIQSRQGVKAQTIFASQGTLQIAELSEGALRGTLQAEFSSDPLIGTVCRSGSAKDGTSQSLCTCTTLQGEVFTCEPRTAAENCCGAREPNSVELALELRASFCRDLCVVSDPSMWFRCVDGNTESPDY